MDMCEWWPVIQFLGHGFLQLLSIVTTWPVMLLIIAWVFFSKFKEPIAWLIRRGTWSADTKVGKFKLQVQEEIPAALAANDPGREDEARASAPTPPTAEAQTQQTQGGSVRTRSTHAVRAVGSAGEGQPVQDEQQTLREQVDQLTQERDQAMDMAWDFYFQWLNTQLVVRTQAALKFVHQFPGQKIRTFREALITMTKPIEAAAIEDVLLNAGLVEIRGPGFYVTDKGERFLDWREDSSLSPLQQLFYYRDPVGDQS